MSITKRYGSITMNLHSKNSTYHKSAKRLADLAAQLAKQSAELIELASALLAEPPTANPCAVGDTGKAPETATPVRPPPASKTEVIASVKAAREVIGLHNKPVQIGTLFREINARGYIIETQKPVFTYGARLRDHRKTIGLTYLQGFGWWLVERPYPPANYTPSSVSRIGRHIV